MTDTTTMKARDRLVVALDVPSLEEAMRLADTVAPYVGRFKVGLELYAGAGPEGVRRLSELAPIFLDLKLHDIPATVARTARNLAELNIEMLTVHAAGGAQMMLEASQAAPKVRLLAVTVLTSLNQEGLRAVGDDLDVKEIVARRATLAVTSGCGGVVASPQEASLLRRLLGPRPWIVTPGVRPRGASGGDQKRVATPRAAVASGADLVVVGRPIRDASDPAAAARAIVDEIEAGLEAR